MVDSNKCENPFQTKTYVHAKKLLKLLKFPKSTDKIDKYDKAIKIDNTFDKTNTNIANSLRSLHVLNFYEHKTGS